MDGDKRMEQARARISDVLTTDIDALRAEVARLTEQLGSFIDDEKATLSKILAKEAKSAKQMFDSKLSDVSSRAGEFSDAAREQASDLQKMTLDYISKKPMQSVAIAAGIGLLLGLWSKNRS
jgi:ElaB/YqjD/DUF883 family membrane-anchored ribosome-binding protein